MFDTTGLDVFVRRESDMQKENQCFEDQMRGEDQQETFKGVITPISWDENDVPIAFSLYTFKGHEYILKTTKYSNKLKSLVKRKVLITGYTINDEYLVPMKLKKITKKAAEKAMRRSNDFYVDELSNFGWTG